jgi:hypothetical protein
MYRMLKTCAPFKCFIYETISSYFNNTDVAHNATAAFPRMITQLKIFPLTIIPLVSVSFNFSLKNVQSCKFSAIELSMYFSDT